LGVLGWEGGGEWGGEGKGKGVRVGIGRKGRKGVEGLVSGVVYI